MNYIIHSPGFRENSGGITVLHMLGKRLQDKGHTVYMLSTNTLDELQLIDNKTAHKIKNESWVIYPEIVIGNPLNAPNVIRWVLNTPGYIGGDSNTWGDDDLVFLLWDYFELNSNVSITGYLRVWDFKLDFFKDANRKRIVDSHLIRKAKNRLGSPVDIELDKHSANSVCIDGNIANDFSLLRETLNDSNLFISYDPVTYYSIIAALCGATSVVIPDGKNSKDEWIKKLPIFKYGIAYGLDDIAWAESTKHMVRNHLIEFENESDELIDNFITITTSKFNSRITNTKNMTNMIYTYIPYSPKDNPYNLGWAYRNFMNNVPKDDDWVCFLDHDATFTTSGWYHQLEDIIKANPEYGCFTCMTNRIGQKYHVPVGVDRDNHDIKYHREIGAALSEAYYDNVTSLNNVDGQYFSGIMILIQKKTWDLIGGCPDGFLGVDNEIHRRCLMNGVGVGRMDGVYLYHWYRADGRKHVDNAMSIHPHALGRI